MYYMRLLPRWTNYVEESKEGKEGNDTRLNQNVIDDYYINLIIKICGEGQGKQSQAPASTSSL